MIEGIIQNKIRTLRFLANEMTQQELSDKVGITRQTINAVEVAKYSPSLELAFKIAFVFNTSIENVFQFNVNHT